MKFTSMFFTASASILSKYTFKRARKLSKRMGENLFSHAMSAANFAKSKHEVYFNVFHSERKYITQLSLSSQKQKKQEL